MAPFGDGAAGGSRVGSGGLGRRYGSRRVGARRSRAGSAGPQSVHDQVQESSGA